MIVTGITVCTYILGAQEVTTRHVNANCHDQANKYSNTNMCMYVLAYMLVPRKIPLIDQPCAMTTEATLS